MEYIDGQTLNKWLDDIMLNGFDFNEKDPLIACVGNNGGTSDYDIMIGFLEAVQIQVSVLKNNKGLSEDTLVYPIVFCMRHCIELGIKINIRTLLDFKCLSVRIASNTVADVKNNLHIHDIEILAGMLNDLSKIDSRYSNLMGDLTTRLAEYFFDKKGDMFRYAESTEEQGNLENVDISHVAILTLYMNFKDIMGILNKLYYKASSLNEEYELNEFTKTCSRQDLIDISKKLPLFSQWNTAAFDEAKAQIKAEYEIGSKEFSQIVDVIKNNRNFSINYGKEIIFGDMSLEKWQAYKMLVKDYSSRDRKDTLILSEIDEDFISNVQRDAQADKMLAEILSNQDLVLLLSFYDISYENEYPELLEPFYNHFIEEKYNRRYLINKLKKEEAYAHVLRGLTMCGQYTYLQYLGVIDDVSVEDYALSRRDTICHD